LQLHISTEVKYDTKAGSAVKGEILALIKFDTTFALVEAFQISAASKAWVSSAIFIHFELGNA
jgi:hypothetical protein